MSNNDHAVKLEPIRAYDTGNGAAVHKIAELGRAAAIAEGAILKPPAEPDHVYLLRGPDGEWEYQFAARDRANIDGHCLLEAIEGFIASHDSSVIYLSAKAITVVQEPVSGQPPSSWRPDVLRISLSATDAFRWLTQLSFDNGFDNAKLYHLLRRLYHSERLPAHEIALFRKLHWNAQTRLAAETGHAHHGMGIEEEAEGTSDGAKAFPEELVFSVPVFTAAQLREQRYQVRVALWVDATTQRLRLHTLDGEIERAEHQALMDVERWIAERLTDTIPMEDDNSWEIRYGYPARV